MIFPAAPTPAFWPNLVPLHPEEDKSALLIPKLTKNTWKPKYYVQLGSVPLGFG